MVFVACFVRGVVCCYLVPQYQAGSFPMSIIKQKVQEKYIQYRTACETRSAEREEKERLEGVLVCYDTAQKLAQQVAQQVQESAHAQVADVVSACLEAVFEEPYTFRIVFEQKRGRTEARLVFERDGLEVDPLTASGGGVVDVASFALRVACLSMQRPRPRMLLILDEPFKFVSRCYLPRVRALLERMTEEQNIQILMVTHIDELRTGKVVYV